MGGARTEVRARVERRADGRARVVLSDPDGLVGTTDVTTGLVATIAHALWQARGGDDVTNWSDAEDVLDGLLAPPAAAFKESAPRPAPPRRASSRR